MAMNVGSSTSATLRQTQQQNQTQQARATQEAEQARQAQQAKKPEQPKPVVNTQGQTTGKVINITA